jgi:uncharacterized protein YeaO (DUF488 family)
MGRRGAAGPAGKGVAEVANRHSSRFAIRRIYDREPADPGYRVLVDRLWPRGVRKSDVALDKWAKELAPTTELRRWYGHDPARFEEFARRYRAELARVPAADSLARLRSMGKDKPVTLLTATRDIEHSGAQVLMDVLTEHRQPDQRGPAR